MLALDGEKKAAPLVNSPFNESHAQISPDGKWIAYTSNLKDNRNEIYVRPFPGKPQRVLIVPSINVAHSGGDCHNYDVSPDGQRFLISQYVPSLGAATGQLGPDLLSGLTVAVNWTASVAK